MKNFIEETEEEKDGLLSPIICQCIESVNLAVKVERELLYDNTCSDKEEEEIEQGDHDGIKSDKSDLAQTWHSYSRTGYLLSPDPLIMEYAKLHLSLEDFETMDDLAINLLMPTMFQILSRSIK